MTPSEFHNDAIVYHHMYQYMSDMDGLQTKKAANQLGPILKEQYEKYCK